MAKTRSGRVRIKAKGDVRVGGDVVEGDKIVYQSITPALMDEKTLAEALELFARLPVEGLPEPAALPFGSRMPFARNPLFVGREEDLEQLARVVKGGSTAAIGQIAAVTGLGGIGKTQLAVEFAHRYGQFFAGGVFWLSFASGEGVKTEVAQCNVIIPGIPRQINMTFSCNTYDTRRKLCGIKCSVRPTTCATWRLRRIKMAV